ncbi:hypothetical protein NN561_019970 [Cricetulus griseus]
MAAPRAVGDCGALQPQLAEQLRPGGLGPPAGTVSPARPRPGDAGGCQGPQSVSGRSGETNGTRTARPGRAAGAWPGRIARGWGWGWGRRAKDAKDARRPGGMSGSRHACVCGCADPKGLGSC